MTHIIKAQANDVLAALQTARGHDDVYREFKRLEQLISPAAGQVAVANVRNALAQSFAGGEASAVVLLAAFGSVCANITADFLAGVRPAEPINLPLADGRVAAFVKYFAETLASRLDGDRVERLASQFVGTKGQQ